MPYESANAAPETSIFEPWSPDLPAPPTYMWTRPAPLSGVNSLSAMPILRSKQSSASECPVDSAIFGMWTSPTASPVTRSFMLRGRRTVFGSLNALS